jgi:hypothetical protein
MSRCASHDAPKASNGNAQLHQHHSETVVEMGKVRNIADAARSAI